MSRTEASSERRARRRPGDRLERTSIDEDRHLLLNDVSWDQYVAVREALDHLPGLRMTYLDGSLELVSPGERHEVAKKLLARLVELYALERDVVLEAAGNMTFRKKARKEIGRASCRERVYVLV